MDLRLASLASVGASAALALPPQGRPQQAALGRSDVSAPLWLLEPARALPPREDRQPRRVPSLQWSAPTRDPVLQDNAPTLAAPQQGTSFEGIGENFVGARQVAPFEVKYDPPDPEGDVGPAHYVQIVNSSFAVFSKQGETLFGPVPTRTLFAGFGDGCETSDEGDGVVLYDPLADRWLISQLAIPNLNGGSYLECIAVSRTSDPMGPYARYSYPYAFFNDYPKLGVWPDAYYATYNEYAEVAGGAFLGIDICAFDREHMLAGEPADQQCMEIPRGEMSGMTPADLDGRIPPPPGEPGMIVGFGRNSLVLYQYHVDWAAPEKTALYPVELAVAPFTAACDRLSTGVCIPQQGTVDMLDALSDRMMFRVAYRNFGNREVLVANHTVSAGSSSGIRWYEVQDPGGEPFIHQQGTYAPDANWRWMGSIAMDRVGGIGLGFSLSGQTSYPAIAYTGRTAADPPGMMGQGEAVTLTSSGPQIGSLRWGDYTSLSVDPSDDCTFWYTAPYLPAAGAFNWRTRIATFALPGCAPPETDFMIWVSPTRGTLALDRDSSWVVSSAALAPAAASKMLAISLSPLPPGITASLAPASIQAGEATALVLHATGGTAQGEFSFLVQAAAGGVVQSAAGTAVVIANDFSLAPERTEVPVGAAGTSALRIATAVIAGEPELITFSASHLPVGVSASFEPASVLAGGSATMNLLGPTWLRASRSQGRVIASSASASHVAGVEVVALAAPHAVISWPLYAQTVSKTARVVVGASASRGTSLSSIELFVDGERWEGGRAASSPAVFSWETRRVSDGAHDLKVRATDLVGTEGWSPHVTVWVDNPGFCGCSSEAGGWEALGLIGLLAALRRKPRPS